MESAKICEGAPAFPFLDLGQNGLVPPQRAWTVINKTSLKANKPQICENLFQGRRWDPEVCLYYFRNRVYDPHTGRFLQRDPVWDPGNVGNQYAFVGNGGQTGRDPMGLGRIPDWTGYHLGPQASPETVHETTERQKEVKRKRVYAEAVEKSTGAIVDGPMAWGIYDGPPPTDIRHYSDDCAESSLSSSMSDLVSFLQNPGAYILTKSGLRGLMRAHFDLWKSRFLVDYEQRYVAAGPSAAYPSPEAMNLLLEVLYQATESALEHAINKAFLDMVHVGELYNKEANRAINGCEKHHIASDKNKKWSPKFNRIAQRFELDLDGDWNKVCLPHRGSHPIEYHEFVLEGMERAAGEATGRRQFLNLFGEYVVGPLMEFPEMLNADFWR